jgi:hypothetical protein
MTTFWLKFSGRDGGFRGVAILDMPKNAATVQIIARSHQLGINPGGSVSVQEVPANDKLIKAEHKNRLILDDDLLVSLGSTAKQVAIH